MEEEICISIVPLCTHIPKPVHKAANILAQRGLAGLGSVRLTALIPTGLWAGGREGLLALLLITAVSGAHIC